MPKPLFKDLRDAGKQLTTRLTQYRECSPVVLALPRGGVVVAGEVARRLGVPLVAVVARKLRAPEHPELAIGGISDKKVRLIDSVAVRMLNISKEQLEAIEAFEQKVLEKYNALYCRPPRVHLKNRTVILVDDGLSSGWTARAALKAIAKSKPKRVILAVPVSGPEIAAAALGWTDDFVSFAVPPGLIFVNDAYEKFNPCPEKRILKILDRSRCGIVKEPKTVPRGAVRSETTPPESALCKNARTVYFSTPSGTFGGILEFPKSARGIVLFAHGSGSGRNSPRNRVIAESLLQNNFAAFRVDLLTEEEKKAEAATHHFRFNVGLLAERIFLALNWLSHAPELKKLPIGGSGASTGASALLAVAAKHPGILRAIVCRGGRPDLVEPLLSRVKIPCLLLTGGKDSLATQHNQHALQKLGGKKKKMVTIPGAGHLFGEPGVLGRVARLTGQWFSRYL